MDTKALFGQVDFAVQEALDRRKSVLDTVDLEEWSGDLLKEDARDVTNTVQAVVEANGWTLDEYNQIVRRFVSNRHTPKHIRL